MDRSPAQRSDAELLTAHVAGDPYAFEELVHRYHRQLLQLARSRSRDPEDAADAVQEALLSAHRGATAFRHHSAVSTWLHRIVINKCVDQVRRDRHLLPLDGERHPVGDATASLDTTIMVQGALATLTPEQRAAVTVVDLHGYSVADAAALLGVAPGTVKSRCARGRTRLARVLAA